MSNGYSTKYGQTQSSSYKTHRDLKRYMSNRQDEDAGRLSYEDKMTALRLADITGLDPVDQIHNMSRGEASTKEVMTRMLQSQEKELQKKVASKKLGGAPTSIDVEPGGGVDEEGIVNRNLSGAYQGEEIAPGVRQEMEERAAQMARTSGIKTLKGGGVTEGTLAKSNAKKAALKNSAKSAKIAKVAKQLAAGYAAAQKAKQDEIDFQNEQSRGVVKEAISDNQKGIKLRHDSFGTLAGAMQGFFK